MNDRLGPQTLHFEVWVGASEARTELYGKYCEGALELATQPEPKNAWQSFWLCQKVGQA